MAQSYLGKTARRHTRRRTAQLQERLDKILHALSLCIPQDRIEAQFAKEWGVKRRTIREYINIIHADWRQFGQDPNFVENRRNELRLQWHMLMTRATTAGDLKSQAQCLKEMGHLDGAYTPKEIKVDGQFAVAGVALGTLGVKSAEEVRERIAALTDAIATGKPNIIGVLPPALAAEYAEHADDSFEDPDEDDEDDEDS